MSETVIKPRVKNLLICAGAFYILNWIAFLLQLPYGKMTSGIIYFGDFGGAVLLPLVLNLPKALCAFGVGAIVFWLVESEHPICWALFPAILYFVFGLQSHHWARPLNIVDREAQVIGALFPAISCVVGAITVRWRVARRNTPTRPNS